MPAIGHHALMRLFLNGRVREVFFKEASDMMSASRKAGARCPVMRARSCRF